MSSWMFDSLMVWCIVAGLYWLEQGKPGRSGLALAAGTLIKIVPVFIVPVLLVSMIAQRNRQIPRFLAAYLLVVILPCLPFLSGIGFVLGFHGQRVGGGLNWQGLWYFLSTWFPAQRWDDYIYSFSGAIGALVLILGMLLMCALVYRYRPPALETFIIALAGYLAFTKIVNEVYALPLVPLLLLQLARSYSPELDGETLPLPTGRHLLKLDREIRPLPLGKTRRKGLERCYKLVWSVPLAFALVNVPFFHFTLPFLGNLELGDSRNASLISTYQPRPELSLILFLTGIFFTGLCLTIMALMLIPKKAVSY
jgi:hypothetical protein